MSETNDPTRRLPEIDSPRPTLDTLRALRPRERLFSRGPGVLSDAELLVLVLGVGTRGDRASAVAARLAGLRDGVEGMSRLSPDRWCSEAGLGRAAAARLSAVFELGRRAYRVDREESRPSLGGPGEAFRQVRHLGRAKKEHLVGLYLDAQNGLLHRETISIGSLNTTRTHPREILFPAIQHLALGFILAHNHPSGCLDPSPEDIEFTRAIRQAGELMGIELYDHLIVAGRGYTSLRERGLL